MRKAISTLTLSSTELYWRNQGFETLWWVMRCSIYFVAFKPQNSKQTKKKLRSTNTRKQILVYSGISHGLEWFLLWTIFLNTKKKVKKKKKKKKKDNTDALIYVWQQLRSIGFNYSCSQHHKVVCMVCSWKKEKNYRTPTWRPVTLMYWSCCPQVRIGNKHKLRLKWSFTTGGNTERLAFHIISNVLLEFNDSIWILSH